MALEQVIWMDGGGGSLDLNNRDTHFATRKRVGVWSPVFKLQSSRLPLAEGSQLERVVIEERGLDLEVKLRGQTRAGLYSLLRDLSQRMDPTKGNGQIKVISEDGSTTRLLNCRPEGMTKVDEQMMNAVLTLSYTAFDPYWYANTDTVVTFTTGGQVTTFFPFFPLRVTNSTVFSSQTIANAGDAPSYPILTIAGPGQNIALRNITTGKWLALSGILSASDTIVIDTRIGKKSILLNGNNAFDQLVRGSSFWSLAPGNNVVNVEISLSTGGTSAQIRFTPRYLSI
jgi:phage-related protein